MTPRGGEVLAARVAEVVTGLARTHDRVLVGVDGGDAAGKTTFGDRLAAVVAGPVVRASGDGFHHPPEVRRQEGALSPEGYYRHAFDHGALVRELLGPFAAGASRVRTATWDHHREVPYLPDPVEVPERAVLVVDGLFLLRPELRDHWTLTVHLRVSAGETLRRARVRDVAWSGTVEEVERRYLARYLPAQDAYRTEADPEAAAHLLVDNEDPAAPILLRWAPPGT